MSKFLKEITNPDDPRSILTRFYQATNGFMWKKKTNWLSKKPVKEWYGVSTNWFGEVESICLCDNNLCGILPELVFKKLKVIHFIFS